MPPGSSQAGQSILSHCTHELVAFLLVHKRHDMLNELVQLSGVQVKL